MDNVQATKVVEALLYMTDHPLTSKEIIEVLEGGTTEDEVVSIVREIADKLNAAGSPLQVVEVAGGVQMATRPDMARFIRKLYKERLTVRLSPSALETLAIVAYKQPIARSEIEQIRGVEATGVMETLVERRLVKVVGRKETIGRPLLYGTTVEFLRQFGLKHLTELPDLNSFVASLEANPPAAESTPITDEPELVGVGAEEVSATSPEPSEPTNPTTED